MPKKQYPKHESSFKISPNYVAMLTYFIPLIYIILASFIAIPGIVGYILIFSPFIFYFIERKSEFVRFHAVQSILLNVALPLIFELLVMIAALLGLHHVQLVGIAFSFIYLALVLGIVALSVYGLIKAYFYYTTSIPLFSKLAYYLAKDSKK